VASSVYLLEKNREIFTVSNGSLTIRPMGTRVSAILREQKTAFEAQPTGGVGIALPKGEMNETGDPGCWPCVLYEKLTGVLMNTKPIGHQGCPLNPVRAYFNRLL